MLKKDQKGIGHFILIGVIAILIVSGIVAWRLFLVDTDNNSDKPKSTQKQTESDPVLYNFGLLNLDEVLITEQAVGEYENNGLKGFYIFGDNLPGGRINPNFEFASVKDGVKVVSATDGVVMFIRQQTDSGDAEVFVQSAEGSIWTIGYDHLTNLSVKQGDKVKVGDPLGEPAVQNNGLRRFEIQINKDQNSRTTHICPSVLLASSVKEKLLAELIDMQNSWEATTGIELYDIAKQNPAGCLSQSLESNEVESNQGG